MNLFQFYIAEETGGALGEIIVALAVLAALAFILLYVAYIMLIILVIFGRALTKEVKYLKQIRLSSSNPSRSIFLSLSDYDSLVRVLGDTFTFQLNLFSKILRKKKILRFILLFLVQTFGYTAVIVISSIYFDFFGSILLIRKLINYCKSSKTRKEGKILCKRSLFVDILDYLR